MPNMTEEKSPAALPKAPAVRRVSKSRGSSRVDRFLAYTKRFFAQFGTAIVAAAIVGYLFLQLMLNVGVFVEVENASYATITRRAELKAYLFRDEHVIESASGGIDCYLAEDGEKVKKGQNVAVTYLEESDAAAQHRINEINARIEVLRKSRLSDGAATTNISILDEEIDGIMLEIIRDADGNALDKALREKDELLILLNRRNALIHSVSYDAELNNLYSERDSLVESISGERYVTEAPGSGYFYSNVDGYENIFTVKALETLTPDEFDRLGDSVPDESLINNSSGKLVYGSTWYIAVALDKRAAENYRNGQNYPVTFQYSNNTVLQMKLERRLNRTDRDQTILVFSTKVMPDGFDFSRGQTVELTDREYKGLRISSSALRMNDGVTGVYVVQGSRVVFKTTEVLYSYGSYCICEIPVDPNYPERDNIAYNSKTRLSLHDIVITEGSGIYDGMRLT